MLKLSAGREEGGARVGVKQNWYRLEREELLGLDFVFPINMVGVYL